MKAALKISSAIAAVAMFGAGGSSAWAQNAAGSNESVGVDDIVVTATRREESANKIPVAIQALGSKQLEQLNVTNFEKLVEYLPAVRTASRGPGISSIYIRGLSTDTAGSQILGVAGVQPNVALYLNDAPASTPGRNLDIHPTDINRIEVLAGPQGTLFGANAMGGAIRYITNKPDLSEFHAGFTGSAATTKGGAASFGAEGFINIPVVKDKLGVRLAFYSDHQGGYIDNVAGTYRMPWNPGGPGVLPTGNPLLVAQAIESCVGKVNCVATATGTSGGFKVPLRQSISNTAFIEDNYNDANYNGGRATVDFQINEDWSLEAMSLYQELKTNGVFDYAPGVGDLKVQQYGPNTLKDTISLSTLTLKGRLGILDMIFTSSYQDHHSVQQADYAKYANIGLYMPYYNCDRGVYYAGYANSAAQGQTCYSPANSYKVNDRNRRWTQEFRITTPAENRVRATLGAFYDVNRIYDITQWNYVLPAAGFIYNLAPNPQVNQEIGAGVLPGAGFVNTILRRDRQFAIYGEASFDIVPDKLTITGGARYYDESAAMYGGSSTSFTSSVRANCATVSTDPATGLTTCNYVPLAVAPTSLGASAVLSKNLAGINPKSYSGVIFKGNLTYKITPDSLIYATFSEGFRPGGFNRKGANGGFAAANPAAAAANRAYAPDKVKNYELGAKLGLFDRKLQVNLAAYKIDWKDIQMAAFDQNVSNQTFVSNLANARIYGIEGDINARPTSELSIGAGFSYNDTKLTGCTGNAIASLLCKQGVLVPAGSPLALSPKFQGNLRFRYEWEMESGLKPFIAAGMHYVGKTITSDIDNTNILYTGCNSPYAVCGQTAVINGVTVKSGDPIQLQPNSFKQPSYTTFEASIGVSKDQWSLTIYGENLGDKRPQLFTSANDGEKRVTTSRPRTIGMRVSYKM